MRVLTETTGVRRPGAAVLMPPLPMPLPMLLPMLLLMALPMLLPFRVSAPRLSPEEQKLAVRAESRPAEGAEEPKADHTLDTLDVLDEGTSDDVESVAYSFALALAFAFALAAENDVAGA